MQDLTFGEQVKIVLSRKNMTIKELAKKIEIRTKKKMSRQNLTQRLGRDNFQEQDMRMIAEILGCPFHLNILDDNISIESIENSVNTENTANIGNTANIENTTNIENTANIENASNTESTSVNIENTVEEAGTKENRITDGDTGVQEIKEEIKIEPDKSAKKKEIEKAKAAAEEDTVKANVETNERDITIGELVDIHEELDAMMEMVTGKMPDLEEYEADSYTEDSQTGVQDVSQDIDISEQDEYQFAAESAQDSPEEGGGEPVEQLLEEIETIEKEGKREEKQESPEEKAHGWRAYLMQRLKKRAKEQENNQGGQNKTNIAADESSYKSSWEHANQEEGNVRATYSEEYMGNSYVENSYVEDGYVENNYMENGYMEGSYTEDGYADNGYMAETSSEDYGSGYPQELYSEEAYTEDVPPEEEEKGERNPYTGKEYESNSVRMHPSRIGYVQVYDRSNHEWTDMTEWAFLGYQERKKQLLGKDYDPPIYLD